MMTISPFPLFFCGRQDDLAAATAASTTAVLRPMRLPVFAHMSDWSAQRRASWVVRMFCPSLSARPVSYRWALPRSTRVRAIVIPNEIVAVDAVTSGTASVNVLGFPAAAVSDQIAAAS